MGHLKDVLIEFENQPEGQLMSRKWQLIGISFSIVLVFYSIVIKYLEFDLVRTMGIDDVRGYIATSQVIQQLLIIVVLWVAFTFLISFMPMGIYTYSQKLKPVGIILLIVVALAAAVVFTLGYYEVKEIVRFSNHY